MSVLVDDPDDGRLPRVQTLYCFFSVDDKGEEGLCGMHTPNGWVPLVAADETRVESLRPVALQIARATAKRVVLARFSAREDIETYKPRDDA